MYEKVDESIDLIKRYAENNPKSVDFICPWSGKSTLDLALEQNLFYPSRMLYTMGCRAKQFKEKEKNIESKDIAVRVPSVEYGDPMKGMIRFNSVLECWKTCEPKFLEMMKDDIVSQEELADASSIPTKVFTWIQKQIHSVQDLIPFKTKLQLSGSIAEETKIKPVDEIDLVFKCKL